jgi:tetratricopeptide (TPR) repeat protein
MADSQLLRAEEALLEFDLARQPDVESLNAWLDDTRWPQAVRLITGAGGQGKTRLALELCQQRLASSWYAGFLDSNLETNRMTASWQALRNLDQPLLIVIDYAETRQTAFLSLLKSALQSPGNQPVRILLLARDAGEWWDNLPSKDPQCEALLSGYATTGPFRLPALYTAEHDRREAYSKALNAFAQALGVSAPSIVPDLLGEHFERPLYVQMAALLALYGERPTTAQGLTKALLNHERRYWFGLLAPFNWPEPERRAEQLLALTTLAGGFTTSNAAEPYWNKAKGNVLTPADFKSLFRALATLYPGAQGLQAFRPDLLGEALVAQALLRPGADTLLDSVLINTATQPIRRNALTVLARLSTQRTDLEEMLVDALSRHFRHCCLDIVAVSSETTSRLPTLAESAFTRMSSVDKSQAAGLLAPLLTEESVQLAKLSSLVSEYLAEKSREKLERRPGNLDRMGDYGRALRNYSIDLFRTGCYQEALSCALEAMELFHRLNLRDQKRFEPDYAMSLNNYANRLGNVGQDEEALSYTSQALEIYKRLAEKNPNRFEPDYAMSLNNYANCLGDVGQNEEALSHARQSLEIRQRLAEKNPDRFEADYATSLDNYASHVSDIGQNEEALSHARQSLEIRQRLAEKNPDRFEADYAMSLNNYASHLSDVGQDEEALSHARQALKIRLRLLEKNPMRGADELFNSTCSVQFLIWLCNKDKSVDQPDLDKIMTFIPSHQRPLMLLFSAFVEACWATGQAARSSAFQRVLSNWADLSMANKVRGEPYWLCAYAWCAAFEPADLEETNWLDRWQQFAKQRNGRLPQWMLEVARRMEFQWPG